MSADPTSSWYLEIGFSRVGILRARSPREYGRRGLHRRQQPPPCIEPCHWLPKGRRLQPRGSCPATLGWPHWRAQAPRRPLPTAGRCDSVARPLAHVIMGRILLPRGTTASCVHPCFDHEIANALRSHRDLPSDLGTHLGLRYQSHFSAEISQHAQLAS